MNTNVMKYVPVVLSSTSILMHVVCKLLKYG